MKQATYAIYFLALAILLVLGGWQYSRGHEKGQLEAMLAQGKAQYSMIDRAPADWQSVDYRRVELVGEWQSERSFLLANRVRAGRLGYDVYSPVRLAADGALMLVNRGWVAEDRARPEDLSLDGDSGLVSLRGRLYLPRPGFTLGEAPIDSPGWPKAFLYFDAAAMSALLDETLEPGVLVLDDGQPGILTYNWQALVMSSSRHYGYAFQWWGLAITLLVFGFIWRRRASQNPSTPVS